MNCKKASFLAVFALCFFFAQPARAYICNFIWQVVDQLNESVDHHLRHDLEIRAENGVQISSKISDFEMTDFVVSTTPLIRLTGGLRVLRKVSFGYPTSTSSKKIGILNYVVIGPEGEVLEAGASTNQLIQEFKSHVKGREVTEGELQKSIEINAKLYDALTKHEASAKELEKFAAARGWLPFVVKKMKLVYFNRDTFDLKEWAKANHYTLPELRDAGWMSQRFNYDNGQRFFVPTQSDVIKIPYFGDKKQTEIIAWRGRLVNPLANNPSGYVSSNINRAHKQELPLKARFYNAWKLEEVMGRRMVITEGEFKSAIGTHATGFVHIGLARIHEFDHTLLNAIVEARPSEIVIALDRVPKARGLMRADSISDIERAAFQVARELEMAGMKARIAILPDLFDGGKVGLDDLILSKGKRAYLDVLDQAIDSRAYAQAKGMDYDFQELLLKRRRLTHALDFYRPSQARGGPSVNPQTLASIELQLKIVEAGIGTYLRDQLHGSTRLNQPSSRYESLPSSTNVPPVYQETFSNDLLLMEFSSDALTAEQRLPYTEEELEAAHEGFISDNIKPFLIKGRQIAESSGFQVDNLQIFKQSVLAGYLESIFPTQNYAYEFGYAVDNEPLALVILNKNQETAVAIVDFLKIGGARLKARLKPILRPDH